MQKTEQTKFCMTPAYTTLKSEHIITERLGFFCAPSFVSRCFCLCAASMTSSASERGGNLLLTRLNPNLLFISTFISHKVRPFPFRLGRTHLMLFLCGALSTPSVVDHGGSRPHQTHWLFFSLSFSAEHLFWLEINYIRNFFFTLICLVGHFWIFRSVFRSKKSSGQIWTKIVSILLFQSNLSPFFDIKKRKLNNIGKKILYANSKDHFPHWYTEQYCFSPASLCGSSCCFSPL